MVQALRSLLEDKHIDEASVQEALSNFKCAHEGQEADDIMFFLQCKAIDYENIGTTRTYIITNDDAADEGVLQLDGFFSLAIKTLNIKNAPTSEDVSLAVFGDPKRVNGPAYLIGQLARSTYSKKGDGAEYLNTALSYIAGASNIVGGRFVYLDCVSERREYYESHGFTFLQNKKNSDLIQMYRVI